MKFGDICLYMLFPTKCKFLFFYHTELERLWADAKDWSNQCNVAKDPHNGGTFDGNSCRKLLKSCDLLDAICPLNCKPLVRCFRSFNVVVSSCFGQDLHLSYKEDIEMFRQDYLDLNINITPKVHAVIFHIVEFCERVDTGLGRFSEQASESVHHNFKTTWQRFKVLDCHPDYGQRLLRAVNSFNTDHI